LLYEPLSIDGLQVLSAPLSRPQFRDVSRFEP